VKLFVSAENFKSELNACIKAGIKTELEMSPVTHIMLSLLPQDTLHKIEEIRPEIRMLLEGFTRLTTIAENSIHRAKEESADWLTYSQCVHQIASLQNSRIAGDDHWPEVKKGLKGIGQQIESIAEKSTEQITREESACTRLRTWCALLASCSELIERKMKSLEKDLARIKAKISKTRNRLSSHNRLSSPSSQSTLDKLDAKLEQRASTQELLEKENEFCIYCIWMEMKLLKTNFAQVGTMFEELSSCHSIGKRSLSTAWETLGPIAAALVEELDVTSPFQNKIADSNDFPLSPTRIEE